MANVVAICGSLRKGSFNRQLMNASIGLGPEGMTIKEAPSFAKLPIYNFDDQQSTGFPKDSDALHEAVRAADGVLIVSAEYNWSIPGGLEERHRLAVALQGGLVQGQAGVHPVGGAGPPRRLAHAVSPAHGRCRRSTRSCSASPR